MGGSGEGEGLRSDKALEMFSMRQAPVTDAFLRSFSHRWLQSQASYLKVLI